MVKIGILKDLKHAKIGSVFALQYRKIKRGSFTIDPCRRASTSRVTLSDLHSTNGLPLHLMPVLKQAFDMSSPKFMELLKNLSPDLLIYDILQPWAPAAAASLGIPSVVFITTSAAASMYHFHLNAPKDDVVFPYGDTIYYH
ncbi:hypothetical protein Tco_0497829, partial [Tanacetum coccineum]